MTTHELTVDPIHFDDIVDGDRTFELRRADRTWTVGDHLVLREYTADRYTGRCCERTITHGIIGPTAGLADGWVLMSLG